MLPFRLRDDPEGRQGPHAACRVPYRGQRHGESLLGPFSRVNPPLTPVRDRHDQEGLPGPDPRVDQP